MGKKQGIKTLYFHVGKFKTGSTSIQNFLYLNREILKARGVCYPNISDSQAKRFINGRTLFRYLSEGDVPKARKLIEKAMKEASAHSCSDILISNECFSRRAVMQNPDFCFENLTADKIGDLFSAFDFNVKVIVYVRPYVEYVVSFWNTEVLKNATKSTLEEYIERYNYQDELDQLYEYGRVFGTENIIVRPFEREQFKNNNLLDDLLDCIGLQITDGFVVPDSVNESFDRNTLELLSVVNSLKFDKYVHRYLCSRVISRCKGNGLMPLETLPDTFIDKLSNEYRIAENKVALDFLGRDQLFVKSHPKCFGQERLAYEGIPVSELRKLLVDVACVTKHLHPALKTDEARSGWEKMFRRVTRHKLSKIEVCDQHE